MFEDQYGSDYDEYEPEMSCMNYIENETACRVEQHAVIAYKKLLAGKDADRIVATEFMHGDEECVMYRVNDSDEAAKEIGSEVLFLTQLASEIINIATLCCREGRRLFFDLNSERYFVQRDIPWLLELYPEVEWVGKIGGNYEE